jgi:protein-tyrosine phosphatase
VIQAVVARRLLQGSAPPCGSHLPVDLVVLCAEEYQLAPAVYGHRPFGRRARVLRVPLTDGGQPLSVRRTRWALDAAVEVARTYSNGETVLVTCAAGLNRSGLVVALALLEFGVDVNTAIGAIRRARGAQALCNPHFVQFLYSVAGRSMVRIPIDRQVRA